MSMKSSNESVKSQFGGLFSLNEADQVELDALLIAARFLAEVQEICDERKITRKELAKKVGTSASYLTQLYRGDKLINLTMVAKLQKALGLEYTISTKQKSKFNSAMDETAMAEHFDKWFTDHNKGQYFKIVKSIDTNKSTPLKNYQHSKSNKLQFA